MFIPLGILHLFIKSFANPIVDFGFFFIVQLIQFNLNLFFFTELVLSLLLATFGCANLAVKLSTVNLFNS